MVLALVMVFSMFPMSASATEVPTFAVTSAEGNAGDAVTVAVKIENNPGVMMYNYGIEYDTTRLELIEKTKAGMDDVGIWTINVKVLWENNDFVNSTYNGDVLLLKFKIKEDAPAGDAEISIYDFMALDYEGNLVEYTLKSGKITVAEKLETLIPFTKANHTDSGAAIHDKFTGVLGLKVEGIKITNWTEWKQGGSYQEQSITIYVDPASKDDAATLSLSLAEGQVGSGPLIDNPATYTVQLTDGVGSYTASYLVIGSGGLAPRLHIPITFKLGCTEHTFADATCNTPKTCTVCGATDGEADPDAHKYVDSACEYCGATQEPEAPATYEVKVNGAINDAFYVVTGKDANGYDVLGDKLTRTQSADNSYSTVTVPADVTRIGYSDAEGYVTGFNVSPENAEVSIDYVEFTLKNPDGTACTDAEVTVEDSDGYKQLAFDYEWEGMWSISAVSGEAYTITVTAPGYKTAVVEKTFAYAGGYQSFDITLEEEAQEPEAPATYEVKVNGMCNDAFYVVTGKDANGFDVLGDKLTSTQNDDYTCSTITVPTDVTRIGYNEADGELGWTTGFNVSPENAEVTIEYIEMSIKNPDGTACTNAELTVVDGDGYKQLPFDYEWDGMWSISAVIGETYTITVNAPGCKTAVVEKTFASSEDYYQSFDITLEEEAQEPDQPAAPGYTFATSADVSAENGENVVVKVNVTGHSDASVTGYNAYDVTLTFDSNKLEYVGYDGAVKSDGGQVKVEGNTIRIVGCGAEKSFGTEIAALTFKTKGEGEANVTISKVQVSDKDTAVDDNIPEASAKHDEDDTTADETPDVSVVVVPYTVTKPEFISGADKILHGETYTFSYTDNVNYTYSGLTVKVGGVEVTPTEANGVYTIANVTGTVVITATQTANSYDVTKPENVEGPDKATYGENYIFTVTPDTDMAIESVKVTTADGTEIPYTINEKGEYVIAGDKISGAFTITVTQTDTKTTVTFSGIEASEIEGGELTVAAEIGKAFTFKLIKEAAYSYTVKVGDTELNESTTVAGQYTIPADLMVKGGVTVTITKVDTSKATVEVHEYISLDGKVMFLVTAKWRDKVLAYGEDTMFYSSKYTVTGYDEAGAYCWLVVSTEEMKTVDQIKAAAEAAIVEAAEGATVTNIGYDYDINETTQVDVNDAQLAYDMYNASYMEFTENLPMLKFLEADMSTDMKLDVHDVAAIISYIVNGANA